MALKVSEPGKTALSKVSLPNIVAEPFCSANSASTLIIVSCQISLLLSLDLHQRKDGGVQLQRKSDQYTTAASLSTHLNAFSANARFSLKSLKIPPLSWIIWNSP